MIVSTRLRCGRLLSVTEEAPKPALPRTLSGWARYLGITKQTLSYRLKAWAPEEALTRPLGQNNPNSPKRRGRRATCAECGQAVHGDERLPWAHRNEAGEPCAGRSSRQSSPVERMA